jgi:peroxiredoxin
MLREVQTLVAELGNDKLAFYGVAYPQEGRDADLIAERLKKLGISVPVLDDKNFGIGRMLRVQSVPNVTIVDSGGILRLTNGASLLQILEYNMSLESAIRRVVERGSLGTYGYLSRYYPVKELVGKKCPDFEAPLLANSAVQSWHSMIKNDRLNVLVFWSVDCPHCRTWLPEIDAWFKEHPGQANIFGAVGVGTEASKTKTEEYCAEKKFSMPMLVDQKGKIARLFQVTSTPTILIIGPDGVIEKVLLSSAQDFDKAMKEKQRELIKSAG